MAQNGASQECDKPSREIGPIAYFYHQNCADLTSSLPDQNHARSLEEPSQNILLQPCTAMRSSQWAFVLSSLAGACEAFRFTVWLGDKCTISGTGTKPSDQELLVIPQVVGDEGCMVRLFA
jgi:hypothetical protein